MYKQRFNKRQVMRFKHFTRMGYALFSALGKEVLISTLSVTTLTYAKAEGVSVREPVVTDSLGRQDVELDEVVVTGSRAPLTALQTAKIVSVITRDDIHRAAAESINDVLKLATGVDVRQRGGFGVQTDISINGGTFDQITILLNGINISSPQTGHNAADFPVSLSDIERIEILEGASARVFGSSAFSGAVNIVTRNHGQSDVRATVEGGSFGTVAADAGATLVKGKMANSLSAGYTRSDGGTRNSDFDKRRLYYNGRFSSDIVDISCQAGVSWQDYGASTFYSPRFDNQYEETRRYIASLRADIRPTGDSRFVLTPSLYWHRDHDHYQLTRGETGARAGENYHRTDVYGIGMNAYLSWTLGKTALGADVRKEHLLSTAYGELQPEDRWSRIHGSDRYYDHIGDRTNTSFFAEHNIIFDRLTVSAGVLANRNTGLDDDFRFYPGVDVSYRPCDNLKLYVSWNKALRLPTYTDIYIDNATQKGDRDLKPERNSTYKVGATYRCKGLEATASAFLSRGRDMIDWVYQTQESTKYHALNIGKIDNLGLSANLTTDFNELFSNPFVRRITVGYAYIDQQHETEQRIYRSLYALEYLRHKFVAQVDHRVWKRLSASWSLRWQQRMNGFHPYAKLDMKMTWNGNGYMVFVKADNMTAHRYYDIGGVRQPGLWIMAGANVSLEL